MKWAIHWCLTVPHGDPPIAVAGTPAVVIKDKILFMLQLTRLGLPPGQEPQAVIVPILHIPASNVTQIAEQRAQAGHPPPVALQNMKAMLKRFHDYNPEPHRCTIFPSVRELLLNLQL